MLVGVLFKLAGVSFWLTNLGVQAGSFHFLSAPLAPNLIGQKFASLAPVVQKVDNAIHWIHHYPADSVVCFVNTYLLNGGLSD